MDDKLIVFQSKMLQAFLKAFGVTPTPEGLFNALPAHVQSALGQAVEQAPNVAETVKALHDNLPAIVATIADTHRLQVENNVMLSAICVELEISPVLLANERTRREARAQLAPQLAQEVADAALAEASGRS